MNQDWKVKVQKLSIEDPIDVKDAIEGLGGDPNIFYMMLANLENMSLVGILKDIIPALENRDYLQMKTLAHSLKGASAYIGASRLHYVCYYIQEHYVYERYEKMLDYYPSLVEAAIEFKIHSRKIMAENKGK